MRSGRRAHLVYAVLLLALVLVAFRDVVGESRGLAYRDHLAVFRPWFWNLVESLRAGELPTLTRASPAGVPLESLFIPAYTPSTLLLFLGPFEQSYDLFVISLYVILAWGAYALALELGAEPHEAFVAGGFAALAGPVLSFENLLGATVGMAWAPWTFLALARAMRRPGARSAALLALTTGFHLQGVMPELIVADLVALALLWLALKPRPTASLGVTLATAAALALGIAAIRLAPVLEALRGTARAAGFSYDEASAWSVGLPTLVELVVPAFWTPQELHFLVDPVMARFLEPRNSYLTSLYLGTALAPALLGLVAARPRPLHALIAALFFLLALGPLTPVHGAWFSSVPGMSSVRYPVKWLVLFTALAVASTPAGLATARARPRRLFAALALQLALVLGALFTAQLPEFAAYAAAISARAEPAFLGVERADVGGLLVAALEPRLHHALVFLLGGLALAGVAVVRPERSALALRAYGALMVLDLAWAGALTLEGADVRRRPPTAVLAAIESDARRVYSVLPDGVNVRLARDPSMSPFSQRTASDLARGQWRFQGVRQLEDLNRDATSNASSALRFRITQRLSGSDARRALARAGVGWVLSHRLDDTPGAWSFEVPGEPPHRVMPIDGVRDHVTAYPRWVRTDASRWTRRELRELYLSEAAQDVAVVLDGVETSTIAGADCAPLALEHPTTTTTRIQATVDSPCPTVVVALETAVPGWEARVDGLPAPVLDAELGFLGVAVPAGRREVEFEYRARSTAWLPVSLSCACGALLLLLGSAATAATRRWARARRPAPS